MKDLAQTPQTLLRLVTRNAFSQAGGRILLTIVRFAVAVIIARRAGLDLFGQYALVLSFVYMAEWIADFGQTDIAVRDLAAGTRRREATFGALLLNKVLFGALGAILAVAAALSMGYGEPVVRAILWAGFAIMLYALVLVYRVDFRARMRMEKDIGAELISAVVLAAAVWQVTGLGATIDTLVLCYVAARAAYLAAAALFAGGVPRIVFGPGVTGEVRALFIAALPLGIAGLLVSAYDAMDAMALASWSGTTEVGVFTIAARVLMIAVLAVQALGVAVFPVMSLQFRIDRAAFAATAQATIDFALLIGGAIFAATWCGAGGIAKFFKHDTLAITTVLQLLSWAILARVVVTVLAPMVVAAGRQVHTLWLTGIVLSVKAFALFWFVPGAGASGAAIAYLVSEIMVGLLPTILVCQRVTGLRLDWSRPLRSLAAATAVVGIARWLDIQATLAQGAAGAVAFVVLATLMGAVSRSQIRQILTVVLGRNAGRFRP